MLDYLFKNCTSLRNCNVASSQGLILGGAPEQLSGLCFQKPSALGLTMAAYAYRPRPRAVAGSGVGFVFGVTWHMPFPGPNSFLFSACETTQIFLQNIVCYLEKQFYK